ncbi:MAG TPA: hypothetical protein VII50_01825 [Acidothermaceae bacterium]
MARQSAAAPAAAVYVTNSGDATISAIDADTDAVVATIPVGQRPWAVTVSSDGTTAYVSDSLSAYVSVLTCARARFADCRCRSASL